MNQNQTKLILLGSCMSLILAFVAIQEAAKPAPLPSGEISEEEIIRLTTAPSAESTLSPEEQKKAIDMSTGKQKPAMTAEEEAKIVESTSGKQQ